MLWSRPQRESLSLLRLGHWRGCLLIICFDQTETNKQAGPKAGPMQLEYGLWYSYLKKNRESRELCSCEIHFSSWVINLQEGGGGGKRLAHGNRHIKDDNVIVVINPLHSAMTHACATVTCLRTNLWPSPSNACGNIVPSVWPAGVIPALMAEYLVCVESRSCPLGREGPYFVWMWYEQWLLTCM